MSENQRNREQLEMVDSDVESDIDSDVGSTEEESTGPPTFCTFLKKERKVKFFFIFQAYHGMPQIACEGEFSGVRVNGSWHG